MKFRHRLSGKLILLFLVMGLLIALTVRTGFRYGLQDEFRNIAAPHLMEYIDHLQQTIGDPPDRERAIELSQRLGLNIIILSEEGVWSSQRQTVDPATIDFHSHRIWDGEEVEIGRDDHYFYLRLQLKEHTLLLSPNSSIENSNLPLIVTLTIIAVLLFIALAYHLVRRLFHPIESIRLGVMRFGEGDLAHRITINRRDELGELAKSFNSMAGEIQQMLEGKRQLLLAISHELRSPLTRARVNAELLEKSEPQQRIIQDLQQMEMELTELLETERLGSRHANLDLQPVSPGALIEEVVERHFQDRGISYDRPEDEQEMLLDPVRIKLMIRNLLDNALRHTPSEKEPPRIESRQTDALWTLTVEDQGVGIAKEHLQQITEPFYRADKARQRETGGYGLGLYLCKVIAEAHGGSLSLDSEIGRGTRVTALFPVKAAQQ